jgi:hypothetical protein
MAGLVPTTVLFSLPALLAIAVDPHSTHAHAFAAGPAYTAIFNCFCMLGVFYVFSSSEVGGSQISFANRKSSNLRTYKIWYICRPSASVVICGFALCGPNIFRDL